MGFRKRIYEIIEVAGPDDTLSHIYDVLSMFIIIVSIIPLCLKEPSAGWLEIERVCVTVFIIDYILRLITADYKLNDQLVFAMLRYPFTLLAIIDLLSILPHFIVINSGFGLLRLVRLANALRVFRVFKMFRYSTNFEIIIAVIKRSKESLAAVGTLTLAYIMTSAIIVLNVEPDSFDSFFEAVYWATVSLTTIGYGDIIPATTIGRLITMISAFFGIAVIALPAGIITAGYMEEMQEHKVRERRKKRKQ